VWAQQRGLLRTRTQQQPSKPLLVPSLQLHRSDHDKEQLVLQRLAQSTPVAAPAGSADRVHVLHRDIRQDLIEENSQTTAIAAGRFPGKL
jgi:hypothetical protein